MVWCADCGSDRLDYPYPWICSLSAGGRPIRGAGYMQIAAFISTLMMVGIVTMPVEISYFGKKATIVRNVTAFGFSFIAGYGGVIMKGENDKIYKDTEYFSCYSSSTRQYLLYSRT